MKKRWTAVLVCLLLSLILSACGAAGPASDEPSEGDGSAAAEESAGILTSPEDIALTDVDGSGTNYVFTYDGQEFTARYTPDNWKIIDSWRIIVPEDMTLICEALIGEHPIHGKDLENWRTAEDMSYEWLQHNIVFQSLPENHPYKDRVKDVDLDPKDQGKTYMEMYRDRAEKEQQQ